MAETLITQHSLTCLIQEIESCLTRLDSVQSEYLAALKIFSTNLNLKQNSLFQDSTGEVTWLQVKEKLKIYSSLLAQGADAYQDLSSQIQTVVMGRSSKDPLFQEIARQGNLLLQDLQKRQEFARYVLDLESVIDNITISKKATPPQKQQVEDLVFRIQLLS